jgi:type I restriction enzyme M protein
MISKMEREGSKIAVVTNGSTLFTGDAGSGESEIRKWIITNDWLDCIIGLPKDLFYNTGINTYIWFLSNKKPEHRKGKVQLINANILEDRDAGVEGFCRPEKKSLGNKRNKIEPFHIEKLLKIYSSFEEGLYSKIFQNEAFGYYQLTVDRPEYDSTGNPIRDRNGKIKPDSKKRDKEFVPLGYDIDEYFKTEVLPHVPDAWIDYDKTRIGYEINFGKYFYEYKKLRSSNIIKDEVEEIEKEISILIKELLA